MELQINDILYRDNDRFSNSSISKHVVVKVTPTTATIIDVQRPRIEIIINRKSHEYFSIQVGFSGKGEYKYQDWYPENPTWIEKYERQDLLSFLTHELRFKSDWQKLPIDKLTELKNLLK